MHKTINGFAKVTQREHFLDIESVLFFDYKKEKYG